MEASLCIAGACETFAVPDGVPCNDNDFCTVGDQCSDGECVGVRAESEVSVTDRVETFGGIGEVTSIGDDALLFVDNTSHGARLTSVAAAVEDLSDPRTLLAATTSTVLTGLWLTRPVLFGAEHAVALGSGGSLGDGGVAVIGLESPFTLAGTASDPGARGTCLASAQIGDTLWCCTCCGQPSLLEIELSDPASPTLSSLPLSCTDLAADPDRNRLLALGPDHALSPIDVSVAGTPVAGDAILEDVASIVGSGVHLYVVQQGAAAVTNGADAQLVALDLATDTAVSVTSVETDDSSIEGWLSESVVDLWRDDVLVWLPAHVERWNVEDPSAPVLVEESSNPNLLGIRSYGDGSVGRVEGDWLLFGSHIIRRFTPDALDVVLATGPQHGTTPSLRSVNGLLSAVGPLSARLVSAGGPAQILSGGAFPFLQSAVITSFGSSGPYELPTSIRGDVPQRLFSGGWIDVSSADAPQLVQYINLENRGGGVAGIDDDRVLSLRFLEIEGEARPRVDTYSFADLTPTGSAWEPRASLTLETSSMLAQWWTLEVRWDVDATVGVAATAWTSAQSGDSELVVLDISNPDEPLLLVRRAFPTFSICDVELADGVVVALGAAASGSGNPCLWDGSNEVRVYDVVPDVGGLVALTERARFDDVDLPGFRVTHATLFNGQTLAMNTVAGGLHFLDVDDQAILSLGEVQLGDAAYTAVPLPNAIAVGEPTGIELLEPPCPPLP